MPAHLPFNKDLAVDWANGLINSKQVQGYALSARQQGAGNIGQFAKMGNYERNPQNTFRAMRTVLGLPAGAPEMDWYN